MNDHVKGVKLQQRIVPFPKSVSGEAQALLHRSVGSDGIPFNALHAMPQVNDLQGWMRLKSIAGVQYEALAEKMAAQARSTVETVTVGKSEVHIATPSETFEDQFAYIDLHGGALVLGGGTACRAGAQNHADAYGIRCFAVDYRMPPEHPYPAALDDCVSVYCHVLERYSPQNVVIGGRSAGANLAAALTLRARDEGLPLPAAAVLCRQNSILRSREIAFTSINLLTWCYRIPLCRQICSMQTVQILLIPILPLFSAIFPEAFHRHSSRRAHEIFSFRTRFACTDYCAEPKSPRSFTSSKLCRTVDLEARRRIVS